MASSHPTLTSALQDTFHKIETLGSAAFGGAGQYKHVPQQLSLPPSSASRVTDSIFGNPAHDIHKVRIPSIIHEDVGKLASNMQAPKASGSSDAVAATDGATSASRKKYIIGIIVVCFLLLAVVAALFFIRRRNKKRAQEESELAEAAEEQFRQQMLLQNAASLHEEEAPPQFDNERAKVLQIPRPTQSQQQTPPALRPASPKLVVPATQAAAVPFTPAVAAPTPAPVQTVVSTPIASAAPVPIPSSAPVLPSSAPVTIPASTPTTSMPLTIPTSTPTVVSQTPKASNPSLETETASEIESAVAKTLETRRRLETLRQQLDAGIQSVVGNVSESVAKTIASQRAFSAHSSDQEYDEKVLLNTGTPNISTTPLDVGDLPSISLLEKVAETHPEQAQPIGENI